MSAQVDKPLDAFLSLLLGGGLAGSVLIIVRSYRLLRHGKIEDDDSLLHRVHAELKRQEKRADEAEEERDREADFRRTCQEKAERYRRALVAHGINPEEDG